jgi:hypothetical protein
MAPKNVKIIIETDLPKAALEEQLSEKIFTINQSILLRTKADRSQYEHILTIANLKGSDGELSYEDLREIALSRLNEIGGVKEVKWYVE